MLECRCILRCIRAIAADSLTAASLHRPLALTPRIETRRLATAVAVRRKRNNGLQDLSSDGKRATPPNRDEKALKTELAYLKDPAKLAEHVHYTLRNDNPEKALNLCRMASKSMSCVVSWNHVIDWHMKQGKVNEAIKIFNEMKKRAQHPDSYTYIMLLRGFPLAGIRSDQAQAENFAVKAVAIYNGMTSPTSKVKPNIMHTNATLKVCSFARDMDSLWSVASKLPEQGRGAADHRTYSIILGAIRHNALLNEDATEEDNEHDRRQIDARSRQRAVDQGRRIWQDIIAKWRAADLMIDESLVVDMANLLLFSRDIRDWDDVLSLVRQTTDVERLIPTIDSPERNTAHVPQREDPIAPTEDEDGWVPTPAGKAFKAVTPLPPDAEHPKRPTRLNFVQPGNGILNVVLRACTEMRIPQIAYRYFDKLVLEQGIKPDDENIKIIFSILHLNRSSARAVTILKQLHDQVGANPTPRTYQAALNVCQRDWKNASIMTHATAIIEDMEQNLRKLSSDRLCQYLSLALQVGNPTTFVSTLAKLDGCVDRMRKDLQFEDPSVFERSQKRITGLISSIVGDVDRFMQRATLSPDQLRDIQYHRNLFNHKLAKVETGVQTEQRLLREDANTLEERKVLSKQGGKIVPLIRRHMKFDLGEENRQGEEEVSGERKRSKWVRGKGGKRFPRVGGFGVLEKKLSFGGKKGVERRSPED